MKQEKDLYDAVVIGGGPAGLAAGMYLARARYRVLIIEKDDFGGQVTITAEVVNYPGVRSMDGTSLTGIMRQQAQDFGAEFKSAQAIGLDVGADIKIVHTDRGDFRTFGILLATGASPRKIGFQGEQEYAGRGVSYCATCDGEFFAGKEVLVVGGGFASAEESVFLTKYATKVTVLIRQDDFTCDASVAAEAKSNENIDILYNTELQSISAGEGGLSEAVINNTKTGQTQTWKPADGNNFGLFVFAGYVPQTSLVKDVIELDSHGYVQTHGYLETSVPGIYAAGDLREKNLRQVVTATSDGAIAAVELERYASQMSKKTGLVPPMPQTSTYERQEANAADKARISGTSPAPATVAAITQASSSTTTSGFFDDAICQQLDMVFGKMRKPLVLQLELDDSDVSTELESFISELVSLSDGRLRVISDRTNGMKTSEVDRGSLSNTSHADAGTSFLPDIRPSVRICIVGDEGTPIPTGLAFHGVPSGHEFNSFVLGLYNAAGPGQAVDDDTAKRIADITAPVDVMLLVSLSCTMCPTTVLSSQRIAAENPNVRAEAYDIGHFPELKEKYGVMSVPCIVISKPGNGDRSEHSGQKIEFGKKNVSEMLDLIAQA